MKIRQRFESTTAKAIASCGALLLVWVAIESGALPRNVQAVVGDVSNTGLNDADVEMQTRNYYREVSDVDVGRFVGFGEFLSKLGLIDAQSSVQDDQLPLAKTAIVHRVHQYLPWELKPNDFITFRGHPFHTNRWGMRDRDYEKQKPAGVFRMAIVGASNTMGNGVAVEEGYVELVEDRLNAELAGRSFDRYEMLNFSVGGYDLTDRLFVAVEKMPEFQPDVIFLIVLERDLKAQVYQRVAERLTNGDPIHFAFLEQIAREAGAQVGDSETKLRQRLQPFSARLLKGSAEEMKRLSDRLGVPVVPVVLNIVVDRVDQALIDSAKICDSVGLPTLRIFNAYEGYTSEQVHISPSDHHPVPLGHRLIADKFYSILLDHPQLGPMIRGETRKEDSDDAP